MSPESGAMQETESVLTQAVYYINTLPVRRAFNN